MKRIHAMAALGAIKDIKELLDTGISINENDNMGKTPLYYAAYFERKDVIEFLKESGADFTLLDEGGLLHQDRAYYDALNALITSLPKNYGTIKFIDSRITSIKDDRSIIE